MPKLIKDWKELDGLSNDKYKIIVNKKYFGGWIIPISDESTEDGEHFECNCEDENHNADFFDHHVYLTTHTFYGSNYEYSTKLLQKYGFDVEIDNWDKEK